MITYNHNMKQGGQNVLIDYTTLGKSSDVNSVTSSTFNRTKVLKGVLCVILIALSLIALVLSIIALSEQRATKNSLHKDRLGGRPNKPVERFSQFTHKVTKTNISNTYGSQDESINQLKRTIDSSIAKIKAKLSKLFSVAFHAVVDGHPVINKGTNIKFNLITLNEGNGYNGTTGIFTVPEGCSGLYFLYIDLIITTGNIATFQMNRNEEQICAAEGDNSNNGWNHDTITCGGVVQLNQGDQVYVELIKSKDRIPLFRVGDRRYHVFTGFLMKPELI